MGYEEKRAMLLNEAKTLLEAKKLEEAETKMKEIEELDAAHDAELKAQANFEALNGKVIAKKNGIINIANKEDKYTSKEYMNAFMEYVCRNVPMPAEFINAAQNTTTTDASAVIPTTLVREIIQKVEARGNIYAKVRKMNVQGGVEFPILTLKPTATWVGEGTSEDKKLQANSKVTFSYFGLEVKISQSLLASVVTIEEFQSIFVEVAIEAIIKALEIGIINGTGSGQMTGITVDTRVPAANKITLTEAEISDWATWKKKVFAKMPKAYRKGCFIMSQGTFDAYIDGMVDKNGQPIGRVNYGIDGGEVYRFAGKTIETVETDVIPDFDTAAAGNVVAVFVDLSDYAINSNLEMKVVRWTDHDGNKEKMKVIMVCDGKLLDPNGVIIIKKATATS